MNTYPYNIIRNGKKIIGGTQSAKSMEDALAAIKNKLRIFRKSNETFKSNYYKGKPVSIVIFEKVEIKA